MGGTYAQYNNPNQTIIANNGKWFSIYNNYDGSRTAVKGMYGDISVGSPTISDTPGIANDAFNFNTSYSNVTGYIMARSGVEDSQPIHVAGDLIDLSFVVVVGQNDTFNILMIQQFTAGGSVAGVRNSTSTNDNSVAQGLVKVLCSGVTPNHRFSIYMFNTGSNSVWKYYDETVS